MRSLSERIASWKTGEASPGPAVAGRLVRVVGLTLEAVGCRAAVGSLCRVETMNGSLDAEVVGFSGGRLYLMPSGDMEGVVPGARVVPVSGEASLPWGTAFSAGSLTASGSRLTERGPLRESSGPHLPRSTSTRSQGARSRSPWTSASGQSME